MNKSWVYLLAVALLMGGSGIAMADPIDLSSWADYDYAAVTPGGQPPSNWVLSNNNETVTQTVNADPSVYLNGLDQAAFEMDGSWKVITTSDDDFIGFVFGYQDASHFYLFDWKQYTQGYAGTAQEGFTIKKISAANVNDLTLTDFWSSSGGANSTILATSYGSDKGWADNTFYDFYLNFQSGYFTVIVSLSGSELWNVTVNDSSYTHGQFGFYNFSQEQVQYAGFEQTGGTLVPEPATVFLLGAGLIGLAGIRRKSKK